MKKITTIFMAFCLTIPSFAYVKECECGQHSTGIYTYTVDGGSCCNSPIATDIVGFKRNYVNNSGVWEHIGNDVLTGIGAQSTCCNPS